MLDSESSQQADRKPEHNLYRHPERQGIPIESFKPIHDIYALGVVLLEIGLWRPAISMDPDGWKNEDNPFAFKDKFVARTKAIGSLPFAAGRAYAEVVRLCLQGDFPSPESSLGSDFRRLVVDELRLLVYPHLFASRAIQQIDDELNEESMAVR